MQKPVIIRAWDLGGFGDIAGAMRVASHISSGGLEVIIRATGFSAARKLAILQPDVAVADYPVIGGDYINVDVAGHYFDDRTDQDKGKTPHVFIEDMDNPEKREGIVPIYIKTGLLAKGRQVNHELGGSSQNPMFYRPFREWDLPKPGERDAKAMVINAMKGKGADTTELEELLGRTDNIAFGHFRPGIDPTYFLESNYITALTEAAINSPENFALGVFFDKEQEEKVAKDAAFRGFHVIKSDGTKIEPKQDSGHYIPKNLAIVFLGPQPQLTTTSLFLSATMPNIVTGDLSLSDALYGLVAMDGPAFFYDCPAWKEPSYHELARIIQQHDESAATAFRSGSIFGYERPSRENLGQAASVFRSRTADNSYKQKMRDGINAEILKRFGEAPVPAYFQNGLYVPRGAAYLFQDAVEAVLYALMENPELMERVEQGRKETARGRKAKVPATIGAQFIPYSDSNFEQIIPIYNNLYFKSNFQKKTEIGFQKEITLENIIITPNFGFKPILSSYGDCYGKKHKNSTANFLALLQNFYSDKPEHSTKK